MACRVATAALEVLREEDMATNATRMGERVRDGLRSLGAPCVELVRGRGLLNAVVIKVGTERTEGRGAHTKINQEARRKNIRGCILEVSGWKIADFQGFQMVPCLLRRSQCLK